MSVTTTPPPSASPPPPGVTVVTKNLYFTYVQAGTNAPRRHAVQVWNVTEQGWNFCIYTGGAYTFNGKPEVNVFHKKHLVTLSGGAGIGTKSAAMLTKRTTGFLDMSQQRTARGGQFVTEIKSNLPDSVGSNKEKTNEARKLQPEIYIQRGFGNKLQGNTLTVIDCSAFPSWSELAQCFAVTLARGATGVALNAHLFVTGATWHPTVEFGVACVYVCTNGVLEATTYSKALMAVHLLQVDGAGKNVVCQVYHLANAVS